MNEIINALYQRKSVRVFTDDPITDEDKKLILTSAIQAPSAGCQLLYTILDITDQTKKDRLADLCDHQAFIAAGQMVLIFCADCQKWDAFYKEAGISPRCPGAGDLLLAVEDAMTLRRMRVAAESLGIAPAISATLWRMSKKSGHCWHSRNMSIRPVCLYSDIPQRSSKTVRNHPVLI